MSMLRYGFWLLLLGCAWWSSCDDENPFAFRAEQAARDRDTILQYLDANNLEAIEHSSGVFYIIEEPGSTARPNLVDRVTYAYTGYFTNGQIFIDIDPDNPRSSFISALQPTGLQVGVPLLGKGGRIKMFVPSALGTISGSGVVPANTVTIYDVELIDF